MLRVRDIMSEEVYAVAPGISIEEAARELSERRISGAPVLENGRVVGVISKSDLADPDRGLASDPTAKVEDVMTPLAFFVRPGDPAALAVRLMLYEGVHRLLVLDEESALAGIVSPIDVLQVLGRGEHIDDSDIDLDRAHPHADPEMVRAVIDFKVEVR